ncbi:MAG: hypothetical protein U5L96_00020 [Owenweeksia sp.]|nr:hypothetical protein [Owenweeksia sp.]
MFPNPATRCFFTLHCQFTNLRLSLRGSGSFGAFTFFTLFAFSLLFTFFAFFILVFFYFFELTSAGRFGIRQMAAGGLDGRFQAPSG